MQEGQRGDLEGNSLALANDIEPIQGSDGRFGLALHVAESGEVMPADEDPGRLAHRVRVQPGLDPPGAAAVEGQLRTPVDDPIDVAAPARAVACVEIVRDPLPRR